MQDSAVIKSSTSEDPIVCQLLEDTGEDMVLRTTTSAGVPEIGEVVAIIQRVHLSMKFRSGTVCEKSDSTVTVRFKPKSQADDVKENSLVDCQLPAMYRSRSESGHYGCWKSAVIVKHGPDRLVLQMESNGFIPNQSELMFSPIRSDGTGGAGRMYGDDGSVISSSDVQSRRIRIHAITKDIMASPLEGTVLIVMDATRTLYRTA